MALLEIKDLHTYFETKRGTVKANGVSYSVEAERLGLVGESGCGNRYRNEHFAVASEMDI